VRAYDDAHHLTSHTDANGVVATYAAFNAWGSPGTEVRAAATPDAQTITTTYYPLYDLPTSHTVAGPLGPVMTTWDFDEPANDPDPATPNSQPSALVYRELVQGQTLDAAGQPVPFTHVTTYTYNPFAQRLSEDGARAGAADTPRWAYCDGLADEPAAVFGWDPAAECPPGTNNRLGNGNLLAMTTPTGQVTRYGGYDAAGRVGYVLDPDGHRTDYAYSGVTKGTARRVSAQMPQSHGIRNTVVTTLAMVSGSPTRR
jgi:YD repeat-containing protein